MLNTHPIRQLIGIISLVFVTLSALCWAVVPLQAAPMPQLAPPATYYGLVNAGTGFTPTAGMTVTAYVNGNVCGQGQTQPITATIVYLIDVLADAPTSTGCGTLGQTVLFYVGAQVMTPTTRWDNSQPSRFSTTIPRQRSRSTRPAWVSSKAAARRRSPSP